MLDDSNNHLLQSERTLKENDCLVNEEDSNNKVGIFYDEKHDQYWLEVFLHALNKGDQRAQRLLQQKFSARLLDWIHAHPKSDLACHLHTEEYYISETFQCFLSTLLEQQKCNVTTMADVLFHLHVSMNGVILDTLRNYSRLQASPLTITRTVGEVQSNENDNSQNIWGSIEGQLSNPRERRMAYLLFHCALKPFEIVDNFPNEFSNVYEISHVRRNILNLMNI